MTAPWGQQDGEGEVATGSLGREVCVPRNSASPFPRLPWTGHSEGQSMGL